MPAKESEMAKWGGILVLIGSILSVIFGILEILNFGWFLGWGLGSYFFGLNLIFGILLIIFALITLATSGVIKFPWKLEKTWLMLLILGILQALFGGSIGAVLVIIGAILMLF